MNFLMIMVQLIMPGAKKQQIVRILHSLFHLPLRVLLFICVSALLTSCSNKTALYYSGPDVLANVSSAMQHPGFWIARHPNPDQLLLDREGIATINNHIIDDLEMIQDIPSYPAKYDGRDLSEELQGRLGRISAKQSYLHSNIPATPFFFAQIQKNIGLKSIGETLQVSFGLTVHYTNQRRLPTSEPLYSEKDSSYFDKLQNNGLDIGTPLAILLRSTDGQWLYGVAPSSSGWIKETDVALCSQETVTDFLHSPSFIVTTAAKSDLFQDKQFLRYYDSVRMGVRLPMVGTSLYDSVRVKIPVRRDDGSLAMKQLFMQKKNTHFGYLPYTARNSINQAFAMLHEPYGWGGMNGRQDCSRFIKEIYATFGIALPRNSRGQAQVGRNIIGEKEILPVEKSQALRTQAIGGATLLYMPGHVMLFLGMADNRAYVIHAIWGYRQKMLQGEEIRLLNRVLVSDLSLGGDTKKGSLFDRISSIVTVR